MTVPAMRRLVRRRIATGRHVREPRFPRHYRIPADTPHRPPPRRSSPDPSALGRRRREDGCRNVPRPRSTATPFTMGACSRSGAPGFRLPPGGEIRWTSSGNGLGDLLPMPEPDRVLDAAAGRLRHRERKCGRPLQCACSSPPSRLPALSPPVRNPSSWMWDEVRLAITSWPVAAMIGRASATSTSIQGR